MSFLEEENLNFSNVFESRTMLIEITIFLRFYGSQLMKIFSRLLTG
ncbi:hypothetical protein OsccyDRAFT_4401 [Leptolyngbyaceae cyanobacterium JSC-12]|nr:hypothetical protein OsccyDRAFT_4401 [Leptolyngbyaceae cyanobacterium JSC-12]